ncbi:ATPase AAA-type core [Trinorchestia longiramus]|nr:ATPase AAA-type core [Trinorchestia longiramus]
MDGTGFNPIHCEEVIDEEEYSDEDFDCDEEDEYTDEYDDYEDDGGGSNAITQQMLMAQAGVSDMGVHFRGPSIDSGRFSAGSDAALQGYMDAGGSGYLNAIAALNSGGAFEAGNFAPSGNIDHADCRVNNIAEFGGEQYGGMEGEYKQELSGGYVLEKPSLDEFVAEDDDVFDQVNQMSCNGQEMPSGADLEMIEALLAHMQQNPGSAAAAAAAGHMYDDLHDDDDDEDYEDDEEDDDEDDYYAGAADQHSIGMFQNPYSGGAGGGAGGGGEVDAGAVSLLQGLLSMSGAGGMGEMGLAGMGASVMGAPMEASGATSGIMDAMPNPGDGGGATIHEYDDDDEEITEGSGVSEDEDDEDDSEEDDDGHVNGGSHMAAMAAMGGMAAGGSIAAMAAMMGQASKQQHQQQPPSMYSNQPGPVLPHSSPYVMNSSNQSMYSPNSPGMPSSSQPSRSSTLAAAAAVATAAAVMNMPSPASTPSSLPVSCPPAILAPPMSISSGLGGGTMSRVDPLAALAMGGTAAMGGAVLGKVVSTVSNNTGGGTALVKSDHLSSQGPISAPAMHKSLDELNKLSDSMSNARISAKPMPLLNPSMQAAFSHQHLAQMHSVGPSPMGVYPPPFMLQGMIRPPIPTSLHMMPPHSSAMAPPNPTNVKNNDGDKTSLDRESVPCSETSGGGKSDTESTTKKTPSPTLVGPGRVSPDSSSGSSSSGSDRGHVKNATSLASLSDQPSATESMRDSDTDQVEQQMHQLQRRLLHEMEREPMNRGNNGVLMPNPVPMLIENPNYGWSSLVGHENAKDALKNLFQGSKFPEVFDAQGSCRGVLLFGPSGAGKTSLARSLAYEAGGARLIACTPSFIMSRSMHPQAAAGLIRQMFDNARVQKPCVMLMDEIEMLALPELTEAGKWAKAELMAQVRGETTLKPYYPANSSINEQVMLVATTCSPWVLPDELRRLFAYNIHIKLPAEKQREELFRMFLNNYANNVTHDQYKCLLSKSEGYSAADIHTVVRQASYNPPTQQSINGNNQLHQNHPRVVTYDDLASVMTNYRCLYKAEHMSYYKKYIQEATHRTEDMREEDDKKGKPKGVKKLGRFAKSLAAAVISVID